MKTFLFILSVIYFGGINQSDNTQKVATKTYDWNKLLVENTTSGERRSILEGSTTVLDYLDVHATTLNPGQEPHPSHVHADMEELVIVKEGLVELTINGDKFKAGPGSVFIAIAGDDHAIWNAGDTKATYFIVRYQTNSLSAANASKPVEKSALYNWDKIEFTSTSKGGKRQIMQRPTALLSELEIHVTTLNEGETSHAEHVHSNEEIIIVKKGEVEESIEGNPHRLGPGSVILLTDEVSHGIKNAGKGQCEYFAIKWVP